MTGKLNPEKIKIRLLKLHPDWTLNAENNQIDCRYVFDNYYQTMAFANSVAWIAHHYDHHPQMLISYNSCQIYYSTHSLNGLSDLDFDCAEAINALLDKKHG